MAMRVKTALMLLLTSFLLSMALIKYANAASPLNYPENCCLSFDGADDYVHCNSLDSYNTSKFTIELWMRPKYPLQDGSDPAYRHECGSLVSCSDGWTVELDYKSGDLLVGINDGTSMKGVRGGTYGGREAWNTSWYHIAVVYDPELLDLNLKVYVNGTVDWYGPSLGNTTYTSMGMKIGRYLSFVNDTFGGLVDEVRYWNACRSSVEISDSYSRVLNYSELNDQELVGYWRFDEGVGSSSQDYSMQHNNAFLAASPSDPSWVDYGAPIVPEFPSFLTLPLFIAATVVAVIIYRRKRSFSLM